MPFKACLALDASALGRAFIGGGAKGHDPAAHYMSLSGIAELPQLSLMIQVVTVDLELSTAIARPAAVSLRSDTDAPQNDVRVRVAVRGDPMPQKATIEVAQGANTYRFTRFLRLRTAEAARGVEASDLELSSELTEGLESLNGHVRRSVSGDLAAARALTQAARAIEAVRAENQVFFMNSEHQPCALISPSTSLQLCGGWKLMHPSQRCVSFGLSWYATAFCGTLACAPARFNPRPQAAEAPTA